jgi:putative ABC transport system substrate-binding protein
VTADLGLGMYYKYIEFIRELKPTVSRIGFLAPEAVRVSPQGATLTQAAGKAGISMAGTVLEYPVNDQQYRRFFSEATKAGAEAIFVADIPENSANRLAIVQSAAEARLPCIYVYPSYVQDGGLLAYGYDLSEAYRRAAGHVDAVLKGATPAEMPFDQPTRVVLAINLKTAAALGLTISPTLLARANEVIE